MNFKRSLLAGAALALLGIFMSVPTLALATPTQSQIQAAQSKLDELYSKASEASETLNGTKVLISQTDAQIDSLNASIAQTQSDIDAAQSQLEASRAILAQTVEADYKDGNSSLLSIFLNATSFEDLVSRVYYMNKVSAQRASVISETRDLEDSLNAKQSDLSNQKTSLEAQRAQQQTLADQQKSQESTLNAQVSQAQSYLDSLNAEVRQSLKEEQERQAAESKAAADAAKPSSGGSSTSGGGSSSGGSSGGSVTPTPQPASGTRQTVINAAYSMLGGTYVYGACDPANKRFDCSGLTMYCFSQAGISLPHNNLAQMSCCSNVKKNMSDWQAGDLIFWPSHVAIYMGNGMMIDAGSPATGVSYRAVYGGYYGAGWPS